MSVSRGESMQALIGTRHEVNISYPTFDETAGGTVGLPASEPAGATFSYTVSTATHFPVFDNPSIGWTATGGVYCMGLNVTASSQTLSYRLSKNTVSLATGTLTVSASYYWTVHLLHAGLIGLVNGDVLDVRLWVAAGTNRLDWRWNGFALWPTRIFLFNDTRRYALNVNYYDGGIKFPIPTLGGQPVSNNLSNGLIYGFCLSTPGFNFSHASNLVMGMQRENTATTGMYKCGWGDNNTTISVVNQSANNPAVNYIAKITKIQWNELDIRI